MPIHLPDHIDREQALLAFRHLAEEMHLALMDAGIPSSVAFLRAAIASKEATNRACERLEAERRPVARARPVLALVGAD